MTRPLEPIAEAYAGKNNPYRGIEQHGVDANTEYQPVPGYGDTVQVTYDVQPEMQAPVPVLVVNQGSNEERDWDVMTFTVTDRSIQVLGRDPSRTSLRLKNTGPNTVYLSAVPQSNPDNMYPVEADETFSLDAETEVWGICVATELGTLRIVREFTRTMK